MVEAWSAWDEEINRSYFRKGICFEWDNVSILRSHCQRNIGPSKQKLPSRGKTYYCFNCKEYIQEGHHGCDSYECNCWRHNKEKILCEACYIVCHAIKKLNLDVCAIEYKKQMYLVDENLKAYEYTAKIGLPIGEWDCDSQQLDTNEELYTQDRISLSIQDMVDVQPITDFMGWTPEEISWGGVPPLNSGVIRLQDAIERALYEEREYTHLQLDELETRLQNEHGPITTQSNNNECRIELLQQTVQLLTEENATLKAELRALQQQFNIFSLTLMPSTPTHSNPFDTLE